MIYIYIYICVCVCVYMQDSERNQRDPTPKSALQHRDAGPPPRREEGGLKCVPRGVLFVCCFVCWYKSLSGEINESR